MATLEQIIKEARNLPIEEQRRLRAILEGLDLSGEAPPENAEPQPDRPPSMLVENEDNKSRMRRLEWLKAHREEYGGQYVALDGERLLAVGPNYRVAREKARAAGKADAFVTYLPMPDEVAEMGGWR
jgi:hypothetical protein